LSASVEFICRPKQGEVSCGDTAVVVRGERATVVALIDALGHGPEAALTADVGRQWLTWADPDAGAAKLMWGLHGALLGTRGAAATVCTIAGSRVEVAAVGNVGIRAFGSRVAAFASPGILGVRVRAVRTTVSAIDTPTRIVLFSDGITDQLDPMQVRALDAKPACRSLLERYGRDTDDASLVVVDLDARAWA